jgi:hypothetical protein
LRTAERWTGAYLLAGVMVAATFLVQLTNIVLFAVAAVLSIERLTVITPSRRAAEIGKQTALWLVAVGPVAAWLTWNYFMVGDSLATAEKMRQLGGWTRKPVDELLVHPIFAPSGVVEFVSALTRSFWRGELVWHRAPLRSVWFDRFYVSSTAMLLLVAIVQIAVGFRAKATPHAWADRLNGLVVLLFVMLMAWLSIWFDFGTCPYPSRAYPYFVSGRLILGGLVPFLALYLRALTTITSPLRTWLHPLVLPVLIAAAILLGELWITGPVFASPYNLLHLAGY